jgi:hypothetical protein
LLGKVKKGSSSMPLICLASRRPASRLRLLAPLLGFGLAAGCSPATPASDPSQAGSGGSKMTGGSASGGNSGQGGNVGSGGASNGGSSGGGTPGNAGGSNATGGSGAGGASSSGGSGGGGSGSGSGGASVDAAGSTPDGTSGGTGGAGGTAPTEKFSFFTASMASMLKLAKNPKGFGGDLRYGQPDGLSGADKICSEIAESVMPGAAAKGWRAFLSAEKGPAGTPVNAIDRVGEGPWYDRKGRLIAMKKSDLQNARPLGADPTIINDLPNENGLPNSHPTPGKTEEDDNHHFLTGSTAMGTLDATNTCLSWTTTETTPTTRPRTGFSFVAGNRRHWINGQVEGGCGAGVAVGPNGPADPSMHFVGSGGGYGGIYCFALKP